MQDSTSPNKTRYVPRYFEEKTKQPCADHLINSATEESLFLAGLFFRAYRFIDWRASEDVYNEIGGGLKKLVKDCILIFDSQFGNNLIGDMKNLLDSTKKRGEQLKGRRISSINLWNQILADKGLVKNWNEEELLKNKDKYNIIVCINAILHLITIRNEIEHDVRDNLKVFDSREGVIDTINQCFDFSRDLIKFRECHKSVLLNLPKNGK